MNEQPKNSGGLYSRVNVSVRTVNIVIAVAVAALVLVLVIVVANNGFTVDFDTDGGSRVDSTRAMYGELLSEPEPPVKEGYRFDGWFTDVSCLDEWDFGLDTVSGDMTLYAGWTKKE